MVCSRTTWYAVSRGRKSRVCGRRSHAMYPCRRMSKVFHRNPRQPYPVAVRGEGVYLFDAAGKRYLDGSGGAAVSCLGHSDRAVIAAIGAQLEKLPYVHSSFFTSEPMEALAEALAASAPKPLERVY